MNDAPDFEERPVADLPTAVVRSTGLHSPILEPPSPPMHISDGPAFEWSIDRRALVIHAAPAIATAAPFVVIGQAGLGVAAAVCTSAILTMRWIGRRTQFGFGDGFIGYRGGLGWPRGVQEEYDVTWGSAGRRPTANQA